MEAFVHLTNQTQGRERLFRATQYSCMLLSYILEHKTHREKVVMKLRLLESSMSSGRKRLGRDPITAAWFKTFEELPKGRKEPAYFFPLDQIFFFLSVAGLTAFYSRLIKQSSMFRLGNIVHAVVAAHHASQLPYMVPRFCLTASNVNRAMYFACDTVLWVKSAGLLSEINQKKWRHWATKCYYYSLVINLVKDFYELCWRMKQTACSQKPEKTSTPGRQRFQDVAFLTDGELQTFLLLVFLTLKNYPPLLLDMVKNFCDIFSPLDRLGIYKTNPGVIGLCGLISSVVGILTVMKPHLRLKH